MKNEIINFLKSQYKNSARQSRIMEHLKIDTLDEHKLNDYRKAMIELLEKKKIKLTDTNLYTYEVHN
jgi:hypothetical protein